MGTRTEAGLLAPVHSYIGSNLIANLCSGSNHIANHAPKVMLSLHREAEVILSLKSCSGSNFVAKLCSWSDLVTKRWSSHAVPLAVVVSIIILLQYVFTNCLTHDVDWRIALKNGSGEPSGFMGDGVVTIMQTAQRESVKQMSTTPLNSRANMATSMTWDTARENVVNGFTCFAYWKMECPSRLCRLDSFNFTLCNRLQMRVTWTGNQTFPCDLMTCVWPW